MRIIIFIGLLTVASFSENLLVFGQQSTPLKIQQELGASLNGSFHVEAFLKLSELLKFNSKLDKSFVIYPQISMEQTFKLKPLLISSPQKIQKFYLISNAKLLNISKINDYTIGVSRFLSKKALKDFINLELKLPTTRIKYSTKLDDLQGLLGLELVDAILVSESQLFELRKQSKLNLMVIWESPNKYNFSYGVYSFSKEYSQSKLKLIQATPIQSLGIQKWEVNP